MTGDSYIPVGGEMVLGADKSSTAVKSPQKLYIDGKNRVNNSLQHWWE